MPKAKKSKSRYGQKVVITIMENLTTDQLEITLDFNPCLGPNEPMSPATRAAMDLIEGIAEGAKRDHEAANS